MLLLIIANRFFGIGREIIIAQSFGVGKALDIYLLALTIPSLLITLFIYSYPSAMIPIFFRNKEERGDDYANQSGLNIFNSWIFFLLLLCSILYLFSGSLMRTLYSQLPKVEIIQVSQLFRYLIIAVFAGGIFASFRSYFHTQKKFILPSIAPFASNISIILFVILLSGTYGNKSITWGYILGFIFQSLMLFAFLGWRKSGFSIRFPEFNEEVKRVGSALIVVFGIESFLLFFTMIDRVLASGLTAGSISALSYSNTILDAPIAFVGLSIGVVVLPLFSELSVKEDLNLFNLQIRKVFAAVLIFIIPVMFVILFGSEQIVRLLYERGRFDSDATAITASALRYFSIGLLARVFHIILTRIYYALEFRRILLWVALASIVIKLAFSIILVDSYEINGLALATSLTFIIIVTFLLWYLRWKTGIRYFKAGI